MEPKNENLTNTPEMTNKSSSSHASKPAEIVESDATKANKPETNIPLTGSHSAQPGQPLESDLGSENSRVVPPYDSTPTPHIGDNGPHPHPAAFQENKDAAMEHGAPHNQRPAIMGDAAKQDQKAAQSRSSGKVASTSREEGVVKRDAKL